MRIPRKTVVLTAAALIAGGGSYTLGANDAFSSIGQAIIESRCDSGAFIQHASNAGAVAADSETSDSVTQQTTSTGPTVAGNDTSVLSNNLIPNASLNQGSGHIPSDWQNNIYDSNTATFSWIAGDGDSSAVRTSISSYTNGDADWYYAPVAVVPGGYYRYTDYYRSDVSTRAILALENSSGQMQYIDLASTSPANSWTLYQTTFFIPEGITRAMVFHPLAAKGNLDISSPSLQQVQPVDFASPVVTLTFDDGWRSTHDNALPLLKAFNMPSTQYIISGYLGQDKDYMTPGDVYDFEKSGSEIASHTINHPDLTKQSPTQLTYELKTSQQNLGKCYGTPVDFAEPYGTYNAATTAQVEKYYQTARSTDTGFNTADNLNPYGLLVQNVTVDTTEAQIDSWLATAKQNNAWLILVYHQVDNSGTEFSRRPADLQNDLKSIKASGIPVETMHQAYTQLAPQAKNLTRN
jgi:peptidoglycan/xylan/chitin deacetylase (PgdA/CDA1 family)